MEETPITLIGFKAVLRKRQRDRNTLIVRKAIGIGHPPFLVQQYSALFSLHYITFLGRKNVVRGMTKNSRIWLFLEWIKVKTSMT